MLLFVAAPAFAQHAEPDGYKIRDEHGDVVIHEFQGVMLGELEIEVPHEGSEEFIVEWLDASGLPIHPDSLPVEDFSLEVTVDDGNLVTIDYLGQFEFRLNGILEGMTLGRICLVHEDHCDFTGLDFEVHVEEGHFEADGLVIREGGNVVVTVWQGTVTGSIQAWANGGSTQELEVAFLDPDSLEGDLEGDPDFSMQIENDTPSIATMSAPDGFSFQAIGHQVGTGAIRICLHHIDHCDFTTVDIPVDVEAGTPVRPGAIAGMSLRAYPNPFAGSTRVELSLADAQSVRIDVYDVAGRLVRTVHDGTKESGVHSFAIDGRGLASGVYFVRATTPTATEVKKLVLTR
jgi:hypothetical protein